MRQPFVLTCAAVLVLAACNREAPAPAPDPTATEADAPAPAVPTPAAPAIVAPASAPAAEDPTAAFDKGAFAGTFAAGAVRLELHGDGSYMLEGTDDGPGRGTWTHEPASNLIRLDPGSKQAADRVFLLSGRDALAPVDAQGQPAAGQAVLRRRPAG
jgi:hypothetical protein